MSAIRFSGTTETAAPQAIASLGMPKRRNWIRPERCLGSALPHLEQTLGTITAHSGHNHAHGILFQSEPGRIVKTDLSRAREPDGSIHVHCGRDRFQPAIFRPNVPSVRQTAVPKEKDGARCRRLLFPWISGRSTALGMSWGAGLTPERGYALFQAPNRERLKVREFDTDLI
jgi:hypothetical protein